MNDEDFVRKMHAEVKKIEVDRFDHGKRIGHDPRLDDFDMKWVKKHGKAFHRKWIVSKCRTCQKVRECGFKLAKACDSYQST